MSCLDADQAPLPSPLPEYGEREQKETATQALPLQQLGEREKMHGRDAHATLNATRESRGGMA
jgi:hypothetical protein